MLDRQAGQKGAGSETSYISRCVKAQIAQKISDFSGRLTYLPRLYRPSAYLVDSGCARFGRFVLNDSVVSPLHRSSHSEGGQCDVFSTKAFRVNAASVYIAFPGNCYM